MDVCSRNPNRTAPAGGASPCRTDVLLFSRTNGWSWPPHPFQLLAWLLYGYFAVTGFGVFVPLLPAHWIPAGYICLGLMFTAHLCVHLMAVSIDPADCNVRAKGSRGPVPAFDRSKHAHVIEDCHCYLCQVDVGPKSKHCSACNKCVAHFDHHCRWLNNCVGSRNYKLFLHSVLSALVGVALVLIISSYVFIEFFLDPSSLRTDKHFLLGNETGVWFVFLPVAPLRSAAVVIPGLAAVTMSLALLSSVLLSHLLCFHIYLMWNRLSTYEYIVHQRHRQDVGHSRKPGPVRETAASSVVKEGNCPETQAYTNPQLDMEEPTTVALWGEPELHANSRVGLASCPVTEEETPPISFTELYTTENTHLRTQKKKKKIFMVPAEVTREHSLSAAPTPEPLPGFPLRSSKSPLVPAPGPVQAVAPPGEYHSDSAESMEEIPVVLARLGSSSATAVARDPSTPSPRGAPDFAPPSPPPRTKRKSPTRTDRSPMQLRFEMSATHCPVVFLSQASGEVPELLKEDLSLGRRPAGSTTSSRTRSRPMSRTLLGSAVASWMEL